jgi:hypothetical protein
MNKHAKMYEQIEAHGEKLKRIFKLSGVIDPIKLCKQLRRLEIKAHKISTDWCNGENGVTTENIEFKVAPISRALSKIIGCDNSNLVKFNGDARGYALKLPEDISRNHNLFRDMGGNGILAPDFSMGEA